MLDPDNWAELRALGHRMLDDMIDWMAEPRRVWSPMPDAARAEFRAGLPREEASAEAVYRDFQRLILPYDSGNTHPRFFGWVQGGGTAVGALAEMLAGFFDANCGGRDHAALEVERQVIRWAAEMVGMPAESAGLLVTGSSMANLLAVLVARRAALGEVRAAGLGGAPLVAYASAAAHGCVARAMDVVGLGTGALRSVPVDAAHRMEVAALAAMIAADRAAGERPFLVVGTAGTVDIGAVDDLAAIAAVCRREGAWFHVDGAFGATAALSAVYRPLLAGIEHADSLAFDFHKWMQMPYDAGCVLVRDPARQFDTFAQSLAYLQTSERGLAGGAPWPRDLGLDLSRGFRALKVWMSLRVYGADALASVVEEACALARYLAARVDAEGRLELLAPVALNIVCFRVRGDDALNREIVVRLQESGVAAPSTTVVGGKLAIRVGIFNHRTRRSDIDVLMDAVLAAASAV